MLYLLENDAQKKYLYAYKDASFVGYERSVCECCKRTVATAQYIDAVHNLVLEGGTYCPDYLQFCGAGERLFLVSEDALNLFERHKISGYKGYSRVNCIADDSDSKIILKQYYSLDISGSVEFDMKAMHLKKKRVCPVCGQFEWNRNRLDPTFLDETTWDGSDLCFVKSMPGYKACSEALKDVIQANQLTGFSFRPALGEPVDCSLS